MATAANARLLRPWLKGAQLCHLSASGTYASMVAWNRLSPALPPAANNLPCREATPHDERGTHIDATSLHCPSLGSNATTDLSLCRSFVMPPTAYTRPVRTQLARHHNSQHSMQQNRSVNPPSDAYRTSIKSCTKCTKGSMLLGAHAPQKYIVQKLPGH